MPVTVGLVPVSLPSTFRAVTPLVVLANAVPVVALTVPPASPTVAVSLLTASAAAAVVVLTLRVTMLLVSTTWFATVSALAL